jgi:hypothetical protein
MNTFKNFSICTLLLSAFGATALSSAHARELHPHGRGCPNSHKGQHLCLNEQP